MCLKRAVRESEVGISGCHDARAPLVLVAAMRAREERAQARDKAAVYGCHTQSPYGDSYADAGYGDYQDAV